MKKCTKSLATFLFDTTGAKRKVNKREAPMGISRSAERDEGYAPSTGAAFLKKAGENFRRSGETICLVCNL